MVVLCGQSREEPACASRPQGVGCWFEQSLTQAHTRTFKSWAGGTDEENVTLARRSSVSLVYVLAYWHKVSWVLPGERLVTLPLTLLLVSSSSDAGCQYTINDPHSVPRAGCAIITSGNRDEAQFPLQLIA